MNLPRLKLTRRAEAAAIAFLLSLASGAAPADVVAVMSSHSLVTALSKAQVADIFLGKVNRFPNGTPAIAVDQSEGAPARDEFYATFAGKSPAQIKSYWAKIIFTGRGQPPKTLATAGEIKKLLAADPQAIGYIERGAVDGSVKVLGQP
jgi:ABC-type phosphate transport system substrate-binding protein